MSTPDPNPAFDPTKCPGLIPQPTIFGQHLLQACALPSAPPPINQPFPYDPAPLPLPTAFLAWSGTLGVPAMTGSTPSTALPGLGSVRLYATDISPVHPHGSFASLSGEAVGNLAYLGNVDALNMSSTAVPPSTWITVIRTAWNTFSVVQGGGAGLQGTYALSTSAISAASGNTLGSGTIQLCTRSGATLTAGGSASITCYNAAGAILSGAYMLVIVAAGAYSVVVAPCP